MPLYTPEELENMTLCVGPNFDLPRFKNPTPGTLSQELDKLDAMAMAFVKMGVYSGRLYDEATGEELGHFEVRPNSDYEGTRLVPPDEITIRAFTVHDSETGEAKERIQIRAKPQRRNDE